MIMSNSGCIYVIRCGSTDYYKIGITYFDPHKRLEQLQTANPFRLHFVLIAFIVERPVKKEVRIHRKFRKNKVRGEWFKFSRGELVVLKKNILRLYGAEDITDDILDGADYQELASIFVYNYKKPPRY